MDITQILIATAITLGILLMTALAVVPLWLEHEAQQARADVPTLQTSKRPSSWSVAAPVGH